MKNNVSIDTNDNTRAIADKEIRNYDGRSLEPGEVLVAMDLGQDFIETNVSNPDSIKFFVAGKSVRKVVFVAVPEDMARVAKGQLNFIQNEDNGKYVPAHEVLGQEEVNEKREEVDPDTYVDESVEDMILKEKAKEIFDGYFRRLLEASPKHAYALLLIMNGINGKEFSDMMKLGHECANVIRKEAEALYSRGLENLNLEKIHANRTKNTDYYREAAETALGHLLDFLK